MKSNKLLIVVLGVSNSYTSMVAKFLLDNGAVGGDLCPERDEEYPRYENRYLKEFEDSFQNFQYNIPKKCKLEDHVKDICDKVVMIKGSKIGYLLHRFDFGCKMKVVYCLRNPRDVIISNMERSKHGFANYFDKYCNFYDLMAMSNLFDVFPFVTERIKYIEDQKCLLGYCDLNPKNIDLSSIKPFKKRDISYLKHRVKSFWKKRLYE